MNRLTIRQDHLINNPVIGDSRHQETEHTYRKAYGSGPSRQLNEPESPRQSGPDSIERTHSQKYPLVNVPPCSGCCQTLSNCRPDSTSFI
jgi:hypothetical protein